MKHRSKPITALVTLLALLGTAQALETPLMKEGLWKVHSTSTSPGGKPEESTYSICRDHAYDKSVQDMVKNMKGCTMSQDNISGNKRTYSSTCKVGSTTIVGNATVTWSGDTSAHSETHTTYSPAFYGKTAETTIMDQTYVGACPAGMNPGDRILADGTVEHHHQR